ENAHPYYQTYIEERRIRRESYRRQYRTRLERLEKYCPHKGKLLDIGCGAGFFLDAARDRGWTPYGIDIVPDFVRFARDELRLSHVHCLPLEQTEFADDFFDAVVLWDLIEHLPHPGACLREIHRILRPGGLVVLWTPNVKNAVYLKARWYGYTPTQHLYFFSPRTLARLLEGSGFQCLYRKTNRAKKGLFSRPQNKPFQKSDALETRLGKLWRGLQRDVKNTLNPVNYLSPVLDWAGYGFNLYVIAHKVGPSPS
ncbi:MAG: methyltransferase domain-containing protein, partial [Nitrospinaceae bacterium]|nr:class I SAM-dependent methyltransferase [Nitrospinaceae bacterium]NIR53266.1 class I SAM-dependent methyltransferase [Nitrospinaceae bacterium]NIS83664.1 class I SAM-dependent methyltransferase [Nitrospinaceae bacterium]NIT80453.1 class I SAM-dependent methyltransferase [Nitrospinaceae bacterium]NIU42791.1 class I SAM-dependent methyltransferase [Nitrospinaceae bacterium]